MRTRQLSFIPSIPKHYGGDSLKGKRKTFRPIDPRKPVHVTFRASCARGELSMLHPRHQRAVERLTRATAQKRGLKLLRFVNVGNHLHLLVMTPSKRVFSQFLKELPGILAVAITGARKGQPFKFWDARAFTRIVEWGRDLRNLELYFIKNLFEASGLLTRRMKAAGVRPIPLFADPPL